MGILMHIHVLMLVCGVPAILTAPADEEVDMMELEKNLLSRDRAGKDVKTLSCMYSAPVTFTYRTYCRVNCRRVIWGWMTFTLCQTIPCYRTYTYYVWKEDICEAETPVSCSQCDGTCCFGEQTCKYQCKGKVSQCDATETFDKEPCKLDTVCQVCNEAGVTSHPCPDECPTRQYVQCEPHGDMYTEHQMNCSDGTVFMDGQCVHFRDDKAKAIYVQKECLPECTNGDFQADDDDCTNFELCEHGTWTKMPCAPGTVYDPELKMCVHAWNARGKCRKQIRGKPKNFCKTPNAMKADEDNCNGLFRCVGGKWIQEVCPPGTKFDTSNNVCNHDWAVDCADRPDGDQTGGEQ